MRQGKSSQEANRLKKQSRREAKEGLPPFYTKVVRVPEDNHRGYTKIVDARTADKLINGKPVVMNNVIVNREKLSRKFNKIS